MKKNLPFLFLLPILVLTLAAPSFAQTYNMTSGTVITCSGFFYDNGGSLANYSNSLSNVTQTFTSSTGNCLTFVFSTFLTQAGNDVLTIYDGPNTSAPVIGNFSGTLQPGTIISSTQSLTFVFNSNNSNSKSGWSATISCASCGTNYLMNSNTTVNTCDGLFYDSGGTSGSYGNNENFTQTFCSNAGNCIQFNFYSINILSGDTLKIYDGPTTSSTLISAYTNTSTTPPKLLSSSGCLTFNFKSNSSGTGTGWFAAIQCYLCPSLPGAAANYTQPTVGLAGSYIGGPMITSCSGTFTDNGGLSGNYGNNINEVYQTFCPATLNNCLRVQFHSVNITSPDYLSLRNGPSMENLPFNAATNSISGTCSNYASCMSRGWGPITASDQSGCISFIFYSNFSSAASGWSATFDCVPCLAGPNGLDNNDCDRSTPLCSNASFSDASTGPGIVADVDDPCLISETYSNWYTLTLATGGTLGMTIDPLSTGAGQPEDYDWALYGPNNDCSTLGNPIRCSSATTQGQSNNSGNAGNTGISTANNLTYPGYSCFSNNDVTEDACGNCWVNDLNVNAGETYYLCISKWSSGGSGFNLTWNLTNGASLECPVLPVELTSFTCKPESHFISIDWLTASELNNDYYTVEKSADGENYEWLTTVPGKDISTTPTEYFTIDDRPYHGTNYYRLKQRDKSGNEKILQTTACTFSDTEEEVLLQVYDLSGRKMFEKDILTSVLETQLRSLPLPAGIYVITLSYKTGNAELIKYLKVN